MSLDTYYFNCTIIGGPSRKIFMRHSFPEKGKRKPVFFRVIIRELYVKLREEPKPTRERFLVTGFELKPDEDEEGHKRRKNSATIRFEGYFQKQKTWGEYNFTSKKGLIHLEPTVDSLI